MSYTITLTKDQLQYVLDIMNTAPTIHARSNPIIVAILDQTAAQDAAIAQVTDTAESAGR